jgi:DNA-binding NtrC family response regulator
VNQATILVVEDEPQTSRVVSAILRRAGYVVSEARGVAEAREILARAEVPFKLIVCDVVMPDESGAALAEDANRSCHSSKVLLISGLPLDMLEDLNFLSPNVFLGGRAFYKQKPFSNGELLTEVDRILNTKARRADAAY